MKGLVNLLHQPIFRMSHTTGRSIHDNINRNGDFTLSEVYVIRNAFFPQMNIEYLFERKKSSTVA